MKKLIVHCEIMICFVLCVEHLNYYDERAFPFFRILSVWVFY